VSEAIGVYIKAFNEAKRGNRLVALDPLSQRPVCDLSTPALAAMGWAQDVQRVQLPPSAPEAVADMSESPPAPTNALKKSMKPPK
jgi:hypothetical protein